MKKSVVVLIIVAVLFFMFGVNYSITGNIIGPSEDGGYGGPSAENSACLKGCVVDEGRSESECLVECGVDAKPESASGDEGCMQECIVRGCEEEYDFNCQRANVASCEDECGMKGDAPDESEMSEEQLCISDCIDAEDSNAICGNSEEGETGNALCQRCAADCAYLYKGPCLDEEGLEEKERACETCEHCYGEPVEGPSGQGWDCIVDVKCSDASGEFGDDAGSGEDSFEEGHEGPGVVERIGSFFRGLFG